jgi:hypothetical protein
MLKSHRLTSLGLLCFAVLATSACQTTKRAAVSLRPDLDHPLWFEVAKLIATVRTREGVVAGYVLDLEGKHFVCVNNAAWLRDYFKGLPAPPK